MTRPANLLLAALACTATLANAAWARSSDRNQPLDLVSNMSDCNLDDRSVCHFTGDVHISQGTLDISAARADLHRANGELSQAVLTGSPVVLKQVMDDGEPMTARASNVDYDLDTDVVVFTGDVRITQPSGSLSGERVVYNMATGQVTSGGEGNGRVRMRILPKNANGGSGTTPDSATLASTTPASEDGEGGDKTDDNPQDGG